MAAHDAQGKCQLPKGGLLRQGERNGEGSGPCSPLLLPESSSSCSGNSAYTSTTPAEFSCLCQYFQREIKFSFRLKCKIEFGLSPKKAKLQAKLVKYFAHFKILEKQSLVPSQAPCPCTPSLIPPAPSTTSVHHRSWALTPWKLMLQ